MCPGRMKVLVDLIKRLEPKLQGALLLVHRSIMPSYQIIRYSLEKSSGTGGWKSYYKQFNLCALQWKANRMMGMKKTAGDKSGSSNYVNRSHEKTPNVRVGIFSKIVEHSFAYFDILEISYKKIHTYIRTYLGCFLFCTGRCVFSLARCCCSCYSFS